MKYSLVPLLALLLALAACDGAGPEVPISQTAFEATVTGARTHTLSGVGSTGLQERGVPSLSITLYDPVPGAVGGVSFSRAYVLDLRPGTFEVSPAAALAGGFSAIITLPGPPRPDNPRGVDFYWAFAGTLTVSAVGGGLARGTFTLRAGPGPGVEAPEITVVGRFTARYPPG